MAYNIICESIYTGYKNYFYYKKGVGNTGSTLEPGDLLFHDQNLTSPVLGITTGINLNNKPYFLITSSTGVVSLSEYCLLPSVTPTITPSISISPSITPSATISTTPSVSPSFLSTITPSPTPSVSTTPQTTPTNTPTPTPSNPYVYLTLIEKVVDYYSSVYDTSNESTYTDEEAYCLYLQRGGTVGINVMYNIGSGFIVGTQFEDVTTPGYAIYNTGRFFRKETNQLVRLVNGIITEISSLSKIDSSGCVSIIPSVTPTISITPTISVTPSVTPSISVTPTMTRTPSVTPSPSI